MKIQEILLPLYPNWKENQETKFSKVLKAIAYLSEAGLTIYAIAAISEAKNTFLDNLAIISMLIIASYLFVNLVSLTYLGLLKLVSKFRKVKLNINTITSKSWIIILMSIIFVLVSWLYMQTSMGAVVQSTRGYARYSDFGNDVVTISGDWKDDSLLAKEIRNQEIKCDKDTGTCNWITAAVQKWNNNYLSVDMTTFEIKSWTNEKVIASSESDNRIEEIIIYRKNCKMVYTKSPKGGSDEMFKPENITLTMESSYCKQ